jgi:hypothetical protein
MTDSDSNPAFAVQADVRGPWRRYLDALAPLRPHLHRYCCRLTGNDASRCTANGSRVSPPTKVAEWPQNGRLNSDRQPARC